MFSDPEHNIEQFHLRPGMHVADLGAGSGFYTFAASRALGKEGRVYAVEVQKELLERVKTEATRQGLSNVEVIWGNIEKVGGTKLRELSIDAAIVSNVLFQTPDKDALAQEAARIVKPKGKVLVVDWADSATAMGPKGGDRYPAEKARALFEKFGFAHEEDIRAGDHHYGMVLRKS